MTDELCRGGIITPCKCSITRREARLMNPIATCIRWFFCFCIFPMTYENDCRNCGHSLDEHPRK